MKNLIQVIYLIGDNKFKSGSNAYVDDLFDLLDDQIKEEIVEICD